MIDGLCEALLGNPSLCSPEATGLASAQPRSYESGKANRRTTAFVLALRRVHRLRQAPSRLDYFRRIELSNRRLYRDPIHQVGHGSSLSFYLPQ